jgi:hypothetical protein
LRVRERLLGGGIDGRIFASVDRRRGWADQAVLGGSWLSPKVEKAK